MIDEALTPPFEKLYVVRIGKKKRVYHQVGIAKSQITREVDQYHGTYNFLNDCELWQIDESGWKLLFSVAEGDSYVNIPWDNAIFNNTVRRERWEQEQAEREEARAREEYKRLKERFEAN